MQTKDTQALVLGSEYSTSYPARRRRKLRSYGAIGTAVLDTLEERRMFSVGLTDGSAFTPQAEVAAPPSVTAGARQTNPTISGSAYASIGVDYTLNLNDGSVTNVTHWTINWGDGTSGTINNPSSCSHIFVAPASGLETISASVVTSTGQTFTATTNVTIDAAPIVKSVVVNNGAASRSTVTSLSVTFSEPVITSGGAFSVTETATTPTLVPQAFGYHMASTNGGLTYTISFPQSSFPQDIGNSLPDGIYSFAINPAGVSDTHGVLMESGSTYGFYRLAGDTTGKGTVGGTSYLPTTTLNPVTGATSGTAVTIQANPTIFGNNGDKMTYQWIVKNNGTEVMLPGSYGSGTPMAAGETQITPIGSVITTTPQLTFIPTGNAAAWTAQVITTDASLNLSTTSSVTTFNVAANTTRDKLATTILPNSTALKTITYNGLSVLNDGSTGGQYTNIEAFASDGSTPGGAFVSYNPTSNTYSITQGALNASVQFSRLANELDFTFTVSNNASAASGLYFSSFAFTLAFDLHNLQGQSTSILSSDISEAQTSLMSNGVAVGTVAVGLQEKSPGEIGFFQSGGGNNYSAEFNTTAETQLGQPGDPLYPGQTATYHAYMRFSSVVNADLGEDAAQALSAQAFKQNGALITGNESSVNWNDRRPITELFPMTQNIGAPNSDSNLAYDLLSYAASEIDTMLQDGSQGAITWDISDPSIVSAYNGAPEMATTLIPQLSESVAQMGFASNPSIGRYYDPKASGSLVDEYFAMFHNAGLKTGVTIRMTQVDPQQQNGVVYQTQSDDPISLLVGRIEYAEQNWGCTMFYIDSIDADSQANAVIAAVHAAVPNALLIPEHMTDGEFANAAGYYQEAVSSTIVRTPGVSDVTSPGVQLSYPDGFIVTRSDLSDPAFTSADVPTIAQALEMGDTFFIQGPGPVLQAQQTLAMGTSSMLAMPGYKTAGQSLVTAPNGTSYDQFSSNGNIIYSQAGTATIQISATTAPSAGSTSASSKIINSAGTLNALLIGTGLETVDSDSDMLLGGPLTNDNVFLAA